MFLRLKSNLPHTGSGYDHLNEKHGYRGLKLGNIFILLFKCKVLCYVTMLSIRKGFQSII
jgi:hypothetical protein